GGFLVHDVGVGVVGELLAPARRRDRAALVAVLLADRDDLGTDQLPALGGALQEPLDLGKTLLLLGTLAADLVDLELREMVEAELEDRVDLDIVELECGHELDGGVGAAVGTADDADRLVEVVVERDEAVEDVQAFEEALLLELELPRQHGHAEVEEVAAQIA